MANAYSLATCILIVRRCTVVIETLFASIASNFKEATDREMTTAPPNFKVFSFYLEDGDGLSDAEPIFSALRVLLLSLGLAGEESELTDEDVLRRLCLHFGMPDHPVIDALLEEADEGEIGIATLCNLATVLNDGHDLWALSVQEGRWGDRCEYGNFGGSAQYLGSHFSGFFGTNSSLDAAQQLQTTLSEGNVTAAAEVVAARVQGILKAVQQEGQRKAVLAGLMHLLQASHASIPQRLATVVLSTAHIPDEAAARSYLDEKGDPIEFGWLWKVPPRLAEIRDILEIPSWLVPILAYADAEGIDRIEFDGDGEVIEQLPFYEHY